MERDEENTEPEPGPAAMRRRIVEAAAGLLVSEGLDATSTRAVAARASVAPPTIFRLFGDKDALLEAVSEYGFETYLRAKARLPESDDPVDDLRAAWDLHVRFGLSRPAYYTLVYGQARAGRVPRAGQQAVAELRRMVTRVAAAGRLRMSIERAAALVHAAGVGTILTLIGAPPEQRDLRTADAAREMVLAAISTPAATASPAAVTPSRSAAHAVTGGTGRAAEGGGARGAGEAGEAGEAGGSGDAGSGDVRSGAADETAKAAMALRAALGRTDHPAVTPAERTLLVEWLNRLADTEPRPAADA
ncbi:TetR/AcrR family transcriptional regulator [Streptomyces sp. NRRL S-340]|uniref:TetR/AcrR family transcriptional regulator n=1 Tax=Streptomyces sp. NRRL S-340 TaxID=1463901 RepID=UPI0007C5A251|nr:TetR/AcrR family transcriptional regulator [Streptomyces sp. NRRL S-340]